MGIKGIIKGTVPRWVLERHWVLSSVNTGVANVSPIVVEYENEYYDEKTSDVVYRAWTNSDRDYVITRDWIYFRTLDGNIYRVKTTVEDIERLRSRGLKRLVVENALSLRIVVSFSSESKKYYVHWYLDDGPKLLKEYHEEIGDSSMLPSYEEALVHALLSGEGRVVGEVESQSQQVQQSSQSSSG